MGGGRMRTLLVILQRLLEIGQIPFLMRTRNGAHTFNLA